MLLLIDNYDSFVYNLDRYLVELGCETKVIRNDVMNVATVRLLKPQAIVISPGPCTPNEAGISIELIRQLSDSIPILGVCLGHQAIAAAFGGDIIRAPEPVHGRTSRIPSSCYSTAVSCCVSSRLQSDAVRERCPRSIAGPHER